MGLVARLRRLSRLRRILSWKIMPSDSRDNVLTQKSSLSLELPR